MTKKEKEYNLNPSNLSEAQAIIQTMHTELNNEITNLAAQLVQTKAERDTKTEEYQTAMNELAEEKSKNKNGQEFTQDQIIAQAKKLGMKTKAEYQIALVKDTAIPESGDYSWLWLIGGAIIILGGLGLIKTKS